MSNSGFEQRGGWWVAAQGVLLLGAAASGLIWHRQWDGAGTRVVALLFLAMGAFCGMAGTLALGRNLTPFPRPSGQTRLVQEGIYRFMRHPLYTAVVFTALGWALFRASWPTLGLVAALAFFFAAKARREERWLRERFPDYVDYERRVRRFVPWIY